MPSPKATELLHRALALDDKKREAFLRAEEADPAIRREVQSLLRAHEGAGGFLETKALPGPERLLSLVRELPECVPGETLGDFEILRELGSGAFARVYLARQLSLNRTVALKISFAAGEEARTLAPLEHEGIVRIFSEHHFPERGWRALCLQYVEGLTLRAVLAGAPGALSPEAVVRLGGELAEALHYAHGRGVLHLDIKPENIFLTPAGRTLLVDFNVARSHGLSNPRGGTYAYMPPEQERMFHDPAAPAPDARADVFALGRVLGELGAFAGGIPELDPVVARSTRMLPEARYATAKEMADALRLGARRARLRRALPLPVLTERYQEIVLAAAIALPPLLTALALRGFWVRAVARGVPPLLRDPILYPLIALLPGTLVGHALLGFLRTAPRRWLTLPPLLGALFSAGAIVGVAGLLRAQIAHHAPIAVLVPLLSFLVVTLAVGINGAIVIAQYVCWALRYPALQTDAGRARAELATAKVRSLWLQGAMVLVPSLIGAGALFPLVDGRRFPVVGMLCLLFAAVSGLAGLASTRIANAVALRTRSKRS